MKKENTYYGGFYWLAALSFIVPIFVAIKAFDKVTPTSKPTPQPDASGVDHQVFDYLLQTYVEHGLVDYNGISRDYLFRLYLNQLAGAQPDKLDTREERLALHCNAYNAFVINGVIKHEIHRDEKNVLKYTPQDASLKLEDLNTELESEKRHPQPNEERIADLTRQIAALREESGFFDLKEHIFAGETISLNHLEHEVIRPTFKEPRVHVALVCAARSCPAIRPEAYVGERIDKQLEDQTLLFANDTRYVAYDPTSDTLKLSPILSWYKSDWEAQGGFLPWLAERVTDRSTREKLKAAAEDSVKVAFNTYDWSLNSQESSLGGGGHGGGGGGFGSGSVPNE